MNHLFDIARTFVGKCGKNRLKGRFFLFKAIRPAVYLSTFAGNLSNINKTITKIL